MLRVFTVKKLLLYIYISLENSTTVTKYTEQAEHNRKTYFQISEIQKVLYNVGGKLS